MLNRSQLRFIFVRQGAAAFVNELLGGQELDMSPINPGFSHCAAFGRLT
jgi:hypothetical protein